MLSNWPPHYPEQNARPPVLPARVPESLPDFVVADTCRERQEYFEALGCDVLMCLHTTNPNRYKVRVLRGDQIGGICVTVASDLTVEDVRDKIVCGVLPFELAAQCHLVCILDAAKRLNSYEVKLIATDTIHDVESMTIEADKTKDRAESDQPVDQPRY